jgi:hypothetical protein
MLLYDSIQTLTMLNLENNHIDVAESQSFIEEIGINPSRIKLC